MALLPARCSRSRSERAADEALRLVRDDPSGPIAALSCWGAVLFVLRAKNVISKWTFDRLMQTTPDNYTDLIPLSSRMVETIADLHNVPRGSILGFFKWREDRRFLAHTMLYVGDGRAVGLNNGAIGQSPAWEMIDLTSPNVANWGGQQSFSYQEIGSNSRAEVSIYYRDIDDTTRCGCVLM